MRIEVTKADSSERINVRRRNQSETEHINATLPKELTQKINGIVVSTRKSRSLVIAELIIDGFTYREGK